MACDCGTPWTFLLPFLILYIYILVRVCVDVLWSSQPIKVMSRVFSLPNHTFSWAGIVL